MKLRHLLVAIGVSALLAAAACEQQTTNPSGYPGSGYPGNGPGAAGAGVSSGSAGSMSSGSSGSSNGPMR
jgi:hypothetical protein